jgi:ribulose-bisphosphate carboxylase large chain
MQRVKAVYLIETAIDVESAVSTLAGEQSSGTFVRVPGETKELLKRFAARVERVQLLEQVVEPSLPGHRATKGPYQRAEVVVSWPVDNFGANLPTLVSTLQGNLYELAQFSGLKLYDIELPESFAGNFAGPRFGIMGTRELTGVHDRPLIGTIIKPSVGLSPQETGDRVRELAEAGIDFVKDDELMANPPHSPFDERVDAVMGVINEHADRTGKKIMYAFNISDELDAAERHYDKIVASGGTCAMVSLNSVGLAGVKKLCDRGELPIHGHRNGWGMMTRHPLLGIAFAAYQKLWRLAGVDQIHVNGIRNKFWEPDDSVVGSIKACLTPVSTGFPFPVLPVVSSGQWGWQAFDTYRLTGTTDLLYLAGGGIMAHPDGIAGGVRAIRQAWNAAMNGESLEEAINQHVEFRHAVEKFG